MTSTLSTSVLDHLPKQHAGQEQGIEPGMGVRVLESRSGWQPLHLGELWRFRELLWFLALRDVQVRYKQTALGGLWAIIQPLTWMVVLEFILTHYLGQPSDPVSRFAKLLPWSLFASAVVASTNSLVSNADMLRKIYFPRLLVPVAAVGAPMVDFVISFAVLLVLMAIHHVSLTWQLLWLPLMAGSMLIATLGVGILMSGLSVAYRDFRYVVPFLVSIGFFLSGVMIDQPAAHWAMHLNPTSGVIAGFRSCVMGLPIDWLAWAISFGSACSLLLFGLFYFARTQRRFADIV